MIQILMLTFSKTVPSEVTLTPVLDPGNVKHADITLNVDWSGKLTLAGFFRVCYPICG
jgi:hypothetical protein